MIRLAPLLPAAAILAAASLYVPRISGALAHGQMPVSAEDPMPVLTDTPEYCNQLERRIRDRPNRPPEVIRLTNEGHQMCDHGEVRAGILRLRRALGLLRHRPGYVVVPQR